MTKQVIFCLSTSCVFFVGKFVEPNEEIRSLRSQVEASWLLDALHAVVGPSSARGWVWVGWVVQISRAARSNHDGKLGSSDILYFLFFFFPSLHLWWWDMSGRCPSILSRHLVCEGRGPELFVASKPRTARCSETIWERRKHRQDCDSIQFKEIATLASTNIELRRTKFRAIKCWR